MGKWGVIFFSFITTITAQSAILFDAVDALAPGYFSAGGLGQATFDSQGGQSFEVRTKYAFSNIVRSQLIVGRDNSNGERFRLGVQSMFSIFPDVPKQMGFGLATMGLFLNRGKNVVQLTLSPVFHERVRWELMPPSLNFYFSTPFQVELSGGHYVPGWRLVMGALGQVSEYAYAVLELGFKLNRADSYVAVGMGTRFTTE